MLFDEHEAFIHQVEEFNTFEGNQNWAVGNQLKNANIFKTARGLPLNNFFVYARPFLKAKRVMRFSVALFRRKTRTSHDIKGALLLTNTSKLSGRHRLEMLPIFKNKGC